MATNRVLTQEPAGLMPGTPAEFVQLAISQKADLATVERAMDLYERWERREARMAYVEAMVAFKKNPPTIIKNKHVSFERKDGGFTEYDHATLDHLCDEVIAGLAAVGLSHHWKVEQKDPWIMVTCVITHESGHFEETMLQGIADASGGKNAIQAIGSTVSYLQRYTLFCATGLASGHVDNDGAGGAPTTERKAAPAPLPTELKRKAPQPVPAAEAPAPATPAAQAQPRASSPAPRPEPLQPASSAMPRPEPARPAPAPQRSNGRVISEAQSRRFFAMRKGAGWSKEQAIEYLREAFGIEDDRLIPANRYEEACRWAQKGPAF